MALVAENKVPHAYVGTRNLRFPLKGLQAYLDAQTNWPVDMVHSGPEQQAGFPAIPADGAAAGAFRAASGGPIR
jgi:hypothetical protein